MEASSETRQQKARSHGLGVDLDLKLLFRVSTLRTPPAEPSVVSLELWR